MKSLDDGVYMVCGPTHGGWGRDVNRAAWREAHVGRRAVSASVQADAHRRHPQRARHRQGPDFFKSAGILMEEKRILAVKSNQAHRASFN